MIDFGLIAIVLLVLALLPIFEADLCARLHQRTRWKVDP